jgi:uncharacterized protein YkwD
LPAPTAANTLRAMRRYFLIATLAVTALGAACVAHEDQGEELGDSTEALRNLESEEAEFLRLINEYRTKSGRAALTATPLLNQVAYDHLLDMATKGYFDHTNKEGQSPFDRMRAAGYTGGAMSENLAAGNSTAAKTFEQWKSSSGHNANMLGSAYRAIGIGRVYLASSPYRFYWTTVFGDKVDSSVNQDAGAPDATPPPPPPADAGTACNGPTEVEPNDDYRAPNALGASVCGRNATTADVDWYSWTLGAGAAYDVSVSAGELSVWKLVGGQYYAIANKSPTRVAGTSNGAGTYLARVRNATQGYTVTAIK